MVVSILLYGCTTWTLTKHMEKKLDGKYTKIRRAILNKQLPAKQQLYGHLLLITKTIQVRRTRHAGHCWRSKNELISDVLQWTPSHGRVKVGRPARTYIQQLCADTAWKTSWERWTIETGGKRGRSVLAAQHDDDDDLKRNIRQNIKYLLDDKHIFHNTLSLPSFQNNHRRWQ